MAIHLRAVRPRVGVYDVGFVLWIFSGARARSVLSSYADAVLATAPTITTNYTTDYLQCTGRAGRNRSRHRSANIRGHSQLTAGYRRCARHLGVVRARRRYTSEPVGRRREVRIRARFKFDNKLNDGVRRTKTTTVVAYLKAAPKC